MNNHYTKVEIIGSEDFLKKIKVAIDNPEILKKYEDQYDYKINDYFVFAEYILKELHVNVKKYWKWNIKAWWGYPKLVSQNKLEFKQLSNNLTPKGWRGAEMLQKQYPSEITAINFYELPEWLQPDEDGQEPGVDISIEEADDIAKFLQEELGIKI